jgi:hypothetical protein
LNHTKPTKLLLSGWSKASEVSGEPDDGYSVYMDLKFVDGTFAYGMPHSITGGVSPSCGVLLTRGRQG